MKKTLIALLALGSLAMGEDVAISQLWDFNSSLLPAEGTTNTITVKDAQKLVTTTITTSSTAFTHGTWDTTKTYNGSDYDANISGLDEDIGIVGVETAGATYLSANENGKTLTITLSGLTAGNEYEIALITGAAGMWQSTWGKITTTNATPGTLTYVNNDGGDWGTQSISRWVPSGVYIDGIKADENGDITITIDQTPSTHRATINALAITGTVTVPEPTTATLSLLALAGLAARRRRK